MEAMSRLRIPGFSESNMFDALADTADRMSKIEGRKAILLIASGIDTFSKLTYDKARKTLQESGVPVYSIEMLQMERIMAEGRMGAMQNLDFLQGDNELKTFAKETGGQAFFPRFQGELPGVFHSISQSLRNQYSLGYSPNNQAKDGKFRKLTVQLVNPGTNEPLKMTGRKNRQADQVHDSGEGRLHGTARCRIELTERWTGKTRTDKSRTPSAVLSYGCKFIDSADDSSVTFTRSPQ